ncbi:MAG TPA: UPF0758 domain-containing protein, partial [Stellaceae bacterium]|nr:UPF0758 domain-containing protein [Stellaceae bacterium]
MAERGRSQSNDDAAAESEPHYHGHRERLRERLLEAGPSTLPDYELLEFLLFAGIPRRDTKPLAKELIARFGGLAGVLAANREALADAGLKDAAIAALLAVREASARFLRGEIADKPVISNWQALIDYCTAKIGFAAVEEFHLLFLDRKNAL